MHIDHLTLHPETYPAVSCYPFNLALFRETPNLPFTTPITFFVGENGTGKSTLLKALCRRCGIHIWEDASHARADYNPYEDSLANYLEVGWTKGKVAGAFFSAETFEYLSRCIDNWASADPGVFDYFGGKSLITQSHGQAFMAFFEARYAIEGLYFLDEPETALSPQNLIRFVQLLQRYSRQGHAQFIICTHSPILLSCPQATIYSFDQDRIVPIEYEQTTQFTIYRDFMTNRHRYFSD